MGWGKKVYVYVDHCDDPQPINLNCHPTAESVVLPSGRTFCAICYAQLTERGL